ncbi:accessory gene regulator B family protein [Hominenteromicrobium sp.]|uniref:accessory gene regulator B family protein n=1 Tax=Hominenteromicrobium sp. TaxID=3073581 RepID=UPI003AEFC4D9
MLHSLSKSVTKWLLKTGAISHNDVALYEYAVYTFFFSMLPLTVSICLGALLHMFFEALLMILPFVLIRKFSGGFHLRQHRRTRKRKGPVGKFHPAGHIYAIPSALQPH